MLETGLGGPCNMCGLGQIDRAEGCKRSRSECAYGKFVSTHAPKSDTKFAEALGAVAGVLARWELYLQELEARVIALEKAAAKEVLKEQGK